MGINILRGSVCQLWDEGDLVSYDCVQHSLISVYILSGHAGGRSIRPPLLMKAVTSWPFIFWRKIRELGVVAWRLRVLQILVRIFQKFTLAHFCYLVGFSSVGERLPHGDAKAPHVTFTGEFVEVYTFWSVPLQWPFTCCTSLETSLIDSKQTQPTIFLLKTSYSIQYWILGHDYCLASLKKCILCSSCHLLPVPWKAQSHWFWRTAGWPAGRCELPDLCAQSSSPPNTSSPSIPGASGWRCPPQTQFPWDGYKQGESEQ